MDEIHDPDQRWEPGFVPVIESDLSRLFSILNDEETSKIGLFDDFWIGFRIRKRKHTLKLIDMIYIINMIYVYVVFRTNVCLKKNKLF